MLPCTIAPDDTDRIARNSLLHAQHADCATLVHFHAPFADLHNRTIDSLEVGKSLRDWMRGRGMAEFPHPVVVIYNGKPLLRCYWEQIAVKPGDMLVLYTLPMGGGGGGGSNPLRMLATIALMVVAPWAGGMLAGMTGLAVNVATGLAFMAGSALVNALLPQPKPKISAAQDIEAASPTYNLQAQGNQARVGQVIPNIYGRHIVFHDFAAQSRASYGEVDHLQKITNEQHLFSTFMIGYGRYDVEQIRIADTLASEFAEVETRKIEPGNSNFLYPPNWVTAEEVSGQELKGTNEAGAGWSGAYIVNRAGSQVDNVEVDFAAPRGIYYAQDNGSLSTKSVYWQVQGRRVDDDGNAITGWALIHAGAFQAASNTPQRWTATAALHVAGRWQFRAKRTDAKDPQTRAGHDLSWIGLRGRLTSTINTDGVTLLQVKARATNSLSTQTSRKFNSVVTRHLRYYDHDTESWKYGPTRSIAWAALDVLTDSANGLGLSDDKIALDELIALDKQWLQTGDTFDAVFDSAVTASEALKRILATGRATAFEVYGRWHFVRDVSRVAAVAMFTPANIVQNSFSIKYLPYGDDTADVVTVTYLDASTWREKTVEAALPDATRDNIAEVKLFGITNEQQAIREAQHIALQNRYRRQRVSFQTEMDGFLPLYGDLIKVVHDMPSWGGHAVLQSFNMPDPASGDVVIVLDDPVFAELDADAIADSGAFIAVRQANGKPSSAYRVTVISDYSCELMPADYAELHAIVQAHPDYELDVAVGIGDSWSQNIIVTATKPRNGHTVEISGFVDDPRVYNNKLFEWNGTIIYRVYDNTLYFVWEVAPDLQHYEVRLYGNKEDGRTLIDSMTTTATSYSHIVQVGDYWQYMELEVEAVFSDGSASLMRSATVTSEFVPHGDAVYWDFTAQPQCRYEDGKIVVYWGDARPVDDYLVTYHREGYYGNEGDGVIPRDDLVLEIAGNEVELDIDAAMVSGSVTVEARHSVLENAAATLNLPLLWEDWRDGYPIQLQKDGSTITATWEEAAYADHYLLYIKRYQSNAYTGEVGEIVLFDNEQQTENTISFSLPDDTYRYVVIVTAVAGERQDVKSSGWVDFY